LAVGIYRNCANVLQWQLSGSGDRFRMGAGRAVAERGLSQCFFRRDGAGRSSGTLISPESRQPLCHDAWRGCRHDGSRQNVSEVGLLRRIRGACESSLSKKKQKKKKKKKTGGHPRGRDHMGPSKFPWKPFRFFRALTPAKHDGQKRLDRIWNK